MSILNLPGKLMQESADRIKLVMENQALTQEVNFQSAEIMEIKEDLLRISDAFDNIGWAPLPETEVLEIPIRTVHNVSKIARSMNALNPFIKRGVNARISYIWGKGVVFDGVDAISDKIQANRKRLFSPQAYEEIERVLATDGNSFIAFPIETPFTKKNASTAFRVPLAEINNAISNPYDKEEVWYYRRVYQIVATNANTGATTNESKTVYYASMAYYQKLKAAGKSLPKKWNNYPVEQNFVVQHTAVNRQVGWRWGVPDIMPVIFWAKAYKEYLEDNAMLVKAYSRLAWQIKAPSVQGQQAAAAKVMAAPTRDPLTGELRSVGGTAISGIGAELAPISANGSNVDFSNGMPLASAIAAGLEVSVVVITSNPADANRATAETLDLPTLKAMESRQNLHTERFLEIFEYWGLNIIPESSDNALKETNEQKVDNTDGGQPIVAMVTWPQIETDTTKDRVTALGTAVELGLIYKQEARKELLNVFGIAPYKDWDDLPTMEDDPAAQQAFDQMQQSIAVTNGQGVVADKSAPPTPGGKPGSVVASQGRSGGIAAKGKAQGTPNAARTARAKDTGNS